MLGIIYMEEWEEFEENVVISVRGE